MRAPFRLIEPASLGVSIETRGVSRSTTARLRIAAGPLAAGLAPGCGNTCSLPFTIFVTGGFATGKKRSAIAVQPNSTIADSTIARIRLR